MVIQLNVTTDYGVRVILYLAQKGTMANSKEICNAMGIPHAFMHKITRVLKNAGLISEKRGAAGGFVLIKDPENIPMFTIINAFERSIKINRCLEEDKFCSRHTTAECKVREFYTELQTELNDRMDKKISTFL